MAFKEFTFIQPGTYTEVMVDINPDTGKIIGLYCYADDVPVIDNYEIGNIYKIHTTKGENPLFLHIQRKAHIFKLMVIHGSFIASLNEDEPEYTNDVMIIEKCLKYYDFSTSIECY